MTTPQLLELTNLLGGALRMRFDQKDVDAWYAILREVDFRDALVAVQQICDEPRIDDNGKIKPWPTPGDVKDRIYRKRKGGSDDEAPVESPVERLARLNRMMQGKIQRRLESKDDVEIRFQKWMRTKLRGEGRLSQSMRAYFLKWIGPEDSEPVKTET